MGLLGRLLDGLTGRAAREADRRRWEERGRRTFALPADVARAAAERLLADAAHYRCDRRALTDPEASAVSALGPTLRQFFTAYAAVDEVYGDTRLARELVGPSELTPGLIRVGHDIEWSELAVEPGGDVVYLLWNEGPPDTPPPRYPSVYHLLLDNAATVGRYEPPPRTGDGL